MNEVKKRTRRSDEFKVEAVRQMENRGSRSIAEVAAGLGISPNQLHAWRREFGTAAKQTRAQRGGETMEEELQRLRRENQSLRQDRETLKKSIAFFVKGH